jgi:multidrug efflux system outer membrane protein
MEATKAVRTHLHKARTAFGIALAAAATLARASQAQTEVSQPPVDDPMLAPPPTPKRSIASWDEALTMIRAQSPDYRSSAEAVARARAQREIALSAVFPSVSAQGTYAHQFLSPLSASLAGVAGSPTATPLQLVAVPIISPPRDAFTAGVTASWQIINPRGFYGVGTADENIDAVTSSFADRRRQIAAAVVDALLATLAAERVADLNRVGLRSALERLALTRTRNQFGQGTELDVDRAQQDVAASRSATITGDESLLRTRDAFGAALGSTVPMAFARQSDLASFQAAVARSCRLNDELERRPDVVAARTRVDIAERAVHDAELTFAPSVSLSSTLQDSSAPVLAPNATWAFGAILNVPIYDGGARYGALKDSRAALEQARQALVQVRVNAVVASAQARRAVGVLEHTRDVAHEQRDLAARVDGRTREGYARGLGTSLDLVTSAQALRQADIQLAIVDFQVEDAQANAVLVNAECVF